jgi:hypothetical protein
MSAFKAINLTDYWIFLRADSLFYAVYSEPR